MSLAHTHPISPVRQSGSNVSLKFRGLMILDLALLIGTLVLTVVVKMHPGPLPGDLRIEEAWQHLVVPSHVMMSFLSFISLMTWPSYVPIQVAAVVVTLLLFRRWLDLILALAVVCLSPATNYIIMRAIDRPRPAGAGLYVQEHVTTYSSFPSGHVEYVLAFLGFSLFLSFQVRHAQPWLWLLRLPLLTMIVFIGPSRLALGEHWPSDTLAGLLWGGFWLVLAIQLYPRAVSRWPGLIPPGERREPGMGDERRSIGPQMPSRLERDKPGTTAIGRDIELGLSADEVESRRLAGLSNSDPPVTQRTYEQIARHNIFTFINICLLALGLALVALGRPMDALSAVGLICFNAVITSVQEMRAKRTLDRHRVVAPTMVTVIRSGREQRIAPRELVAGDLVKVAPDDHLAVDGPVVGGQVLVDESLLSGKPQYAAKYAGDHLISGSRCISGSATYLAEKVGRQSVIHRVAAGARGARRGPTPLQRQINLVFSLSLITAVYIELLLVVRAIISAANLADSVEQSAVIANLVPESMVLTIALTYAIAAIRVLRSGALTQEANAVESLSNLTVLCFDKTGTLTTNRFRLESVEPFGLSADELRHILADLAASSTPDKVSEAIMTEMKGRRRRVISEVPFSLIRRWGAIVVDDPGDESVDALRGMFVIGAPEALELHLSESGPESNFARVVLDDRGNQRGLVLLIARGRPPASTPHLTERSSLPDNLDPIGYIALREEIRPEALDALAAIRLAGIEIKILSGDEPEATARVSCSTGVDSGVPPVSGHDLSAMDRSQFENVVEKASVFGAVTAHQKKRIVAVLRKHGHYVGMVGNGLNDVPALREANVGIAMQGGSDVARDAADLILLNDSLATLPPIMAEGERIVNSLQPAFKLFLTRISASALVILSSLTVAEVFPLRLRHGTILTILTVALPTVLLALRARPGRPKTRGPMRQQAHFVIPAAVLSSMIGLLLFYGVLMLRILPFIFNRPHYTQAQLQVILQRDLPAAQTELVCFLVLTGLILVVFVAPPSQWWAGGSELSGDWQPTMMALSLVICFGILLEIPLFRKLFGLAHLGLHHLAAIAFAALLWLFLVRMVWRVQLGERLLRLQRTPSGWYRRATAADESSS